MNVSEIDIPPEASTKVEISCYLTCHGHHKEVLNLSIRDGEDLNVNILAEGVGHSILVEPTLVPTYAIGYLFTCQEFKLPVVFTNLGKKYYILQFTNRSEWAQERKLMFKDVMESQPLP